MYVFSPAQSQLVSRAGLLMWKNWCPYQMLSPVTSPEAQHLQPVTHLRLTLNSTTVCLVFFPLISLCSSMPGTSGRVDVPSTKTIIVYRNGDAFFPGRKIVVNPRQLLTFDNFLSSLTRGVEAPFGAVRKLYTPTWGHRVQHLEELKHRSLYVAAGNEQFKRLE